MTYRQLKLLALGFVALVVVMVLLFIRHYQVGQNASQTGAVEQGTHSTVIYSTPEQRVPNIASGAPTSACSQAQYQINQTSDNNTIPVVGIPSPGTYDGYCLTRLDLPPNSSGTIQLQGNKGMLSVVYRVTTDTRTFNVALLYNSTASYRPYTGTDGSFRSIEPIQLYVLMPSSSAQGITISPDLWWIMDATYAAAGDPSFGLACTYDSVVQAVSGPTAFGAC